MRGAYLAGNGAGDRSRTRDLLITNQLLYQLSYTGLVAFDKPITFGLPALSNLLSRPAGLPARRLPG